MEVNIAICTSRKVSTTKTSRFRGRVRTDFELYWYNKRHLLTTIVSGITGYIRVLLDGVQLYHEPLNPGQGIRFWIRGSRFSLKPIEERQGEFLLLIDKGKKESIKQELEVFKGDFREEIGGIKERTQSLRDFFEERRVEGLRRSELSKRENICWDNSKIEGLESWETSFKEGEGEGLRFEGLRISEIPTPSCPSFESEFQRKSTVDSQSLLLSDIQVDEEDKRVEESRIFSP